MRAVLITADLPEGLWANYAHQIARSDASQQPSGYQQRFVGSTSKNDTLYTLF